MHIPDHYLTTETCWTTAALAAGSIGISLARWNDRALRGRIAACGWVAAGVFLAQMADFPVGGGTSGHLIGGAVAGILLGPAMGMACMSIVILAQCVLFGDGGTTALGANLLNMAVLPNLVALALTKNRPGAPRSFVKTTLFAGAAGCLSVLLAAAACSAELAWSNTSGFGKTALVMLQAHGIVAIAEGLLTAGIVGLWLRSVDASVATFVTTSTISSYWRTIGWRWAALAAMAMGLVAACFAADIPETFTIATQKLGIETSASPIFSAPFSDYRILGIEHEPLGIALAGLLGAATVALGSMACRRVLASVKHS